MRRATSNAAAANDKPVREIPRLLRAGSESIKRKRRRDDAAIQ